MSMGHHLIQLVCPDNSGSGISNIALNESLKTGVGKTLEEVALQSSTVASTGTIQLLLAPLRKAASFASPLLMVCLEIKTIAAMEPMQPTRS
jgi:hypothetical protein